MLVFTLMSGSTLRVFRSFPNYQMKQHVSLKFISHIFITCLPLLPNSIDKPIFFETISKLKTFIGVFTKRG